MAPGGGGAGQRHNDGAAGQQQQTPRRSLVVLLFPISLALLLLLAGRQEYEPQPRDSFDAVTSIADGHLDGELPAARRRREGDLDGAAAVVDTRRGESAAHTHYFTAPSTAADTSSSSSFNEQDDDVVSRHSRSQRLRPKERLRHIRPTRGPSSAPPAPFATSAPLAAAAAALEVPRVPASPSAAAASASASSSVASGTPLWTRAALIRHLLSPHAIDWTETAGGLLSVPDRPRVCVHPPPFGRQCTMHAVDAIASCLAQDGRTTTTTTTTTATTMNAAGLVCDAFVCPDPGPYVHPRADIRTNGPICQTRATASSGGGGPGRWRSGANLGVSHGMCAPAGCLSAFLQRLGRDDFAPSVVRALDEAITAAGVGARGTGGVGGNLSGGWVVLVAGPHGSLPRSIGSGLALGTGSYPLLTELRESAHPALATQKEPRTAAREGALSWLFWRGSDAFAAVSEDLALPESPLFQGHGGDGAWMRADEHGAGTGLVTAYALTEDALA